MRNQTFCMKYFDKIINSLMNHQLGKKAFAWALFLPMCVCAFAQDKGVPIIYV